VAGEGPPSAGRLTSSPCPRRAAELGRRRTELLLRPLRATSIVPNHVGWPRHGAHASRSILDPPCRLALAIAYGFEGKNGIGTDDDAGGLVLMGARLYDPVTGRFLQMDPVFEGSCNAYDYTCQDPLNGMDINGLCIFGKHKQGGCWLGSVWHDARTVLRDIKKALGVSRRYLADAKLVVDAAGVISTALAGSNAAMGDPAFAGFLGFVVAGALPISQGIGLADVFATCVSTNKDECFTSAITYVTTFGLVSSDTLSTAIDFFQSLIGENQNSH